MLVKEQEYFLGAITSLISAPEAKDIYTRGHSESVANICKGILVLTEASVEDISRIEIGAKLHDIGKIGVKDSVLLKPGKLTPEELDHIKCHPMVGADILQALTSLNDILPIVT